MRPEPAGIAAAQQRRAGRGAHRLDVMGVELDAGRDQLVDVRRLERRAVVGNVLPAQIISDDEEDIGPRNGGVLPHRGRRGRGNP